MGDLTKNFSRNEFACLGENCCGHSAPINPLLAHALQHLRDVIATPITVLSGFRCLIHNQAVGSNTASQHPLGLAADIYAANYSLTDLHNAALHIPLFRLGGVGLYLEKGFIHLDIRSSGPVRWEKE